MILCCYTSSINKDDYYYYYYYYYNLGYIPKAAESLFITNSDIYKCNTRNKDKMQSANGKHEFMYSNFRFVGIHIWNYILDHLDINVTLPKFKTHILADNFTYHIV